MADGEGLAFKAAADHRRYQEVLGLPRPIDERQPHRDDGEGQYGRQSAELLRADHMSDGIGRLRLLMLVFAIGKRRSEEHTSELQSLMRTSYAVFCLKKKNKHIRPSIISNYNSTIH